MDKALNKRNNSIDLFRFFCALLIVAIHVHPFMQFGAQYNQLFTDYVTRIGVPFFFVTSGYFYSKKLYSGKKPYKAYVLKLLEVYLFWSTFYAVFYVKNKLKAEMPPKEIAINIVKGYLYKGVSEHLWFIPSLIVAISVLTLFNRLKLERLLYALSILLFAVACLGFSYRTLGEGIPILNRLYANQEAFTVFHRMCVFGLSFVTLGSIIHTFEKHLTRRNSAFYIRLSIALYGVFIAEKIAVSKLETGTNNLYNFALYPLLLFIFLALLKNPLPRLSAQARYLRNAASFTYYIHPFFMALYYQQIKELLTVYFLVFITTFALSALITKINNRHLNFLNA